jgi:hypothetical protein
MPTEPKARILPIYQQRFTFPDSSRTHFFTEFEADGDERALDMARRSPDPEWELWSGDRRVGTAAKLRADADSARRDGFEDEAQRTSS